jgi:hypothetical protein
MLIVLLNGAWEDVPGDMSDVSHQPEDARSALEYAVNKV